MKKIIFAIYFIKNKIMVLLRKLHVKYNDVIHNALNENEINEIISQCILHKKPLLIARFGSTEANAIVETISIKLGFRKKYSCQCLENMVKNSGFFPNNYELLNRFGEENILVSKCIDILGYWNFFFSDYLLKYICNSKCKITNLRNLEPYCSNIPWSLSLKSKNVVVIHPFKKTIENQYKRRNLIWKDKNVLPDFNLRVVKAVQTIAYEKDDRFNTWFDALEYMYAETMKEDFDVAIIGCGAYGLPLAAKIKKAGKIAIHLGGATQLLFGIKGRRWDDKTYINQYYNEYWVRPSIEDMPKNANMVENGCYW